VNEKSGFIACQESKVPAGVWKLVFIPIRGLRFYVATIPLLRETGKAGMVSLHPLKPPYFLSSLGQNKQRGLADVAPVLRPTADRKIADLPSRTTMMIGYHRSSPISE